MSVVDIITLVFIVLATLHGMIRGLSGELSSFLGIITAFILGVWMQPVFTEWLLANTSLAESSAHAVAFAAIIIGALVVLFIIRHFMKKIMQVVIEEKFDRGLGLIAGFVRAVLIVVVIFVIMNLVPHEYLNSKFGEESVIGSFIKPHIPYIAEQAEKGKEKLLQSK